MHPMLKQARKSFDEKHAKWWSVIYLYSFPLNAGGSGLAKKTKKKPLQQQPRK